VKVLQNNQGVCRDMKGGQRKPCETLAEESDLSGTDLESEGDGEEGVWGHSGVNAETYKRKMVTWKNEIMGKGQKFSSLDAFRYSV